MALKFLQRLKAIGRRDIYGTPRSEKGEKIQQEYIERQQKRAKPKEYLSEDIGYAELTRLKEKIEEKEAKAKAARLLGLSVIKTKRGEEISYKPARKPSAFKQSFSQFRQISRGQPSASTGRKQYGRGRPRGPSGKFVIPGLGPVGVYEYRKWLSSYLREKRINAQRTMMLTPEQRNALDELRTRRAASMQNPENRVIPDTFGHVPLRSIHKEIEDFANEFP